MHGKGDDQENWAQSAVLFRNNKHRRTLTEVVSSPLLQGEPEQPAPCAPASSHGAHSHQRQLCGCRAAQSLRAGVVPLPTGDLNP